MRAAGCLQIFIKRLQAAQLGCDAILQTVPVDGLLGGHVHRLGAHLAAQDHVAFNFGQLGNFFRVDAFAADDVFAGQLLAAHGFQLLVQCAQVRYQDGDGRFYVVSRGGMHQLHGLARHGTALGAFDSDVACQDVAMHGLGDMHARRHDAAILRIMQSDFAIRCL